MEYKYEVFSCSNGNPTAIIMDCLNSEKNNEISEKIYKIMPEVDQTAIIIKQDSKNCMFQLVNGEFCGNACLSVCGYMKKNYGNTDMIITNKVIGENGEIYYINVQSHCHKNECNLIIPREMLIKKIDKTHSGIYRVQMNGITHLILPKNLKNNNKELASKIIDEYVNYERIPEVLGIIFIDKNIIEPYVWINRINLLQRQTSCLSGSIAAATYIKEINSNSEEVIVMQPTKESYKIEFVDNNISVTSIVRCIKSGKVEL